MKVIVRLARRGGAATAAAWTCGQRSAARALGSSLALGLFTLLGTGCGGEGAARHEVSIPWALGGKQLVADLHMHSRYSDGALDADALVRKGYAAGCQAMALTDHSDSHTKTATAEYLNTLSTLRKQFPNHVLIGGLEWNVPPKVSGIHMGVLFDPLVEQHMSAFKQRYELDSTTAAEALGWLGKTVNDPQQVAIIYNHPSRVGMRDAQVLDQWANWRRASPRAIGFEGGPGHQNLKPNGGYAAVPTEDRWDPAITQIGGAWDQLLDRGENPWAALASSDYHKAETEYTPCEFSRTVVIAPDATAAGVLKALHAGSFWASQGRFIDYLLFTAQAHGLEVPASPGETIRVAPGTPLRLRIAVERFADAGAHPLAVEVIGNCKSGKPEQLAKLTLDAKQSDIETTLAAASPGADGTSCYVRARVRGQTAKGEPALAYLNPIRVRFAAPKR
jgi:PHP domain